MALLWIDGFEGYGISGTPVGLSYRWPSAGTTNLTIQPGRQKGYCIRETASIYSITTPAITTNATIIVGCALQFNNSGYSSSIKLYDGGSLGINITIDPSTSTITTKLNTTTIDTSPTPKELILNQWYFVELKVFCDPTNGTVEVRIDEETAVSLSSTNTQISSNPYNDIVRFTIQYSHLDDVYICDGSGPRVNNFLGACKVFALFPSADTAVVEWTPNAAGSHYIRIDENPLVTSDYVYSSTSTETDLYTYPSMFTDGDSYIIYGIQVDTMAQLNTGTDTDLQSPIVYNGITDLGGSTTLTSSTYVETLHVSEIDPDIGLPWTIDKLAAAQIGVRIA
jgi:hypothetical protein